ncbi:hypothetical protein RHGRI_007757 [Rhododendron griersonianum]|uniref:Uncharacterized protein n=1 Tax=Rhododendron griersonianum TaxID=479676 RepID=A0AAV6KXR7_9ERIC|nr:hypothetical protein RHGRI_007757 [Rhododendron griersonianum]
MLVVFIVFSVQYAPVMFFPCSIFPIVQYFVLVGDWSTWLSKCLIILSLPLVSIVNQVEKIV